MGLSFKGFAFLPMVPSSSMGDLMGGKPNGGGDFILAAGDTDILFFPLGSLPFFFLSLAGAFSFCPLEVFLAFVAFSLPTTSSSLGAAISISTSFFSSTAGSSPGGANTSSYLNVSASGGRGVS